MSLALFQTVGPTELLIVLGLVILIFGPKRLPALARQLGTGAREFRDAIRAKADGDDDDEDGDADTDDTAAASRREATAALGRPEEETTQPASDGVVSEKR